MTDCAVHSFFCSFFNESKKEKKSLEISISTSIQELKEEWSKLSIPDIFLNYNYLSTIEQFGNKDVINYFVLLKEDGNTIGAFLFQTTQFVLNEKVNNESTDTKKVKQYISQKINYKILIHGNLYLSGHHMNYFVDNSLSKETKNRYILDLMNEVSNYLREQGTNVEVVLIKDKDLGDEQSYDIVNNGKYTSFCIEPNMKLILENNWNDFEDYLAGLKSKYRVRFRKARSLRASLSKRALTLNDILNHKLKIFELYSSIAKDAAFNIGLFHEDYFYQLKLSLGDKCDVYGYFDHDELIGFYTGIKNLDSYSAHFLGFDNSYNHSHKLYLNILYDLVELGINADYNIINFSRTALEIKSTIGAVPNDLFCYIKMESKIKNKILPYLLKHLVPVNDWVQRSPFKA